MPWRTGTIIRLSVVGGLLAVAVTAAILRIPQLRATGEEGARVWYYDQSEGRLYAVARDTVPPHPGIGGRENDGVRAMVVAPRGRCGDPAHQRIAYLETRTPEYRRLSEGIRAARAAGRAYGEPIPDAESGFEEKNTLVRRMDDPAWHDMTTAEARRIVHQWHGERGPDGGPLEVCIP